MSNYTRLRAIEAEGARIGILSCRRCGTALVIDGGDTDTDTDVIAVHDDWHTRQDTP